MSTYSGLSPQRLQECLDSMRNILRQPPNIAVREFDRLLGSLKTEMQRGVVPDELDWARRRAIDELDRIKAETARVRAGATEPGTVQIWQPQQLRDSAQRLGEHLDARIRAVFLNEIEAAKRDALDVAESTEHALQIAILKQSLTAPIHNASSVKSMIGTIDSTIDALRRSEHLSPEATALGRQAKDRAARHRCQKKRDEADVAEAGGNVAKAIKLRREAIVLLRQDWAQAFPGEDPPEN